MAIIGGIDGAAIGRMRILLGLFLFGADDDHTGAVHGDALRQDALGEVEAQVNLGEVVRSRLHLVQFLGAKGMPRESEGDPGLALDQGAGQSAVRVVRGDGVGQVALCFIKTKDSGRPFGAQVGP